MKLILKPDARKHFKENGNAFVDYLEFSESGINMSVKFTQYSDKAKICVVKDENGIHIDCPEKYFFRAIGIAIKNKNKKHYSVVENPVFKDLTFLIDCSRNGVVNFENFKTLTTRLALLGYTALQIYTEDTLELEDEPYFGHLRGRFSPSELKAMDDFADSVGIELVPYIQTLAHFDNIFLWPEYYKVWDIYNTILIGDDNTYALIEKIFKALRSSLRTKKVNIGFDEAHFVLRGKYADQKGFPKDKIKIVFDHLKKVLSIAEKYGFHASMWSDMFFRLCYDGYYQVEPDTPSEPLKQVRKFVPENVDLIYWDYYHDEKPFYDAMFKKHKIISKNLQFTCGLWKWLGYVPLNRYGLDRLMPGLMSAADNKISEVIVSSWGDNGNEASTFSAIPQFVAAAEFAYRKKFNFNDIKKTCKEIMFANYDDFILLDIPNYIGCKEEKAEKYNPSKYLLYNDPIYGLYDYHTDNDCTEHYKSCTNTLKKAGKRNPVYREIFDMESALCDYLGVKANFGNTLKALYKAGDRDGLKNFATKTVPLAIKKLDAFIITVRNVWLKENKIFGLDLLELRLGGQRQRLKEIPIRINEYLNGKADSLPELEQATLPFSSNKNEKRDISKMLYAYMPTSQFSLERY